MAVIVILMLVSLVQAIEVNVSGKWREELGWEVICTWKTLRNDTLQSVRLYKNNEQFMIYRPERHGPSHSDVFQTAQAAMHIDCVTTEPRGQDGLCKMLLEPYKPDVSDFTYTCEVSGERPWFRIGKQDYLVTMLVPPTKAELTSKQQDGSSASHVMLNCSSSGLPAPRLQWTVEPDTKLEATFSSRTWNETSKLWQAWSYLSYIRSTDAKVLCTPEVTSNDKVYKGESAEFNSANRYFGTMTMIVITILLTLSR